MATTLIRAWVTKGTSLLAWRGYHYRPREGVLILTEDHSLVCNYVKAGILTHEEADAHPLSNVMLKSLGNSVITKALPNCVVSPHHPGIGYSCAAMASIIWLPLGNARRHLRIGR